MNRNTLASTTKCFDEHEEASFQTYSHFMQGNALMCTKRREGVFLPSAQKIRISSTAKQFVHGWKGKNILQGMDKYTQY